MFSPMPCVRVAIMSLSLKLKITPLRDMPADGIIVAVSENYTLPGMDFDQSLQVKIVRELHRHAADRLLVVALRDPYQLAEYVEVGSFVCSFSFRPPAAVAAAEVLLGQVEASGRTPVSVPGTELNAQTI